MTRALGLALFLPALAPANPLLKLAEAEKPRVIETLRDLVGIESPSSDRAALDTIAERIGQRLGELGGAVEFHEAGPDRVQLEGVPERIGRTVVARFHGNGTSRILLLAHMDTVHPRGTLATRPFRIDAGRAYGPGIADDKGGVAVILHAIEMLRKQGFSGYGQLTVSINGDEEISTPGSRGLIARLAAEHSFVLSNEPGHADRMALATSGIGGAVLTVRGKAAHSGVNPDEGRNALLELAHQLLQLRNLSDPARGVKFNWTLARAGAVRNAIPDLATAEADVRVTSLAGYNAIEKEFLDAAGETRLIPDTRVEARFERRRPPLEPTDGARSLYRLAARILQETGRKIQYSEAPAGGGSDAAFAGESGKAAVLEGFGLVGAGFHSPAEEYVELDSIPERLYLLARMIIELSRQ